jgi:iron complex transport system ATP-binding protein
VVTRLAARGIAYDYPGPRRALDGIDLELAPGELVCLVGPNGSGKSTLLRVCAGLLAPAAGTVTLDGAPLATLEPRTRARALAFVPQALQALPDLAVEAFVLSGRYAHQGRWQGFLGRATDADAHAVEAALAEADALDLCGRALDELSRGQFQRVLLARALAQEAPLLLLDEPTSALDPEHQVRLLLGLERLVAAGRSALVVTHELYLASRFAQRCVVLRDGRVVAAGTPAEVFRREVLAPVFGPHLLYAAAPDGERTLIVPWPAEGSSGPQGAPSAEPPGSGGPRS